MNRLAREPSPYLRQHAHNPVDWYPWGEEAFERARREDRPIFLSIGYSTCHWCHVMERESFEDEETAALLNRHFVCVKVDREERPDVDHVYMAAVQAMTGGGGWPLSVFLTPDGKPFWGGTYFPPADAFGRPGFPTVLRSLADAWRTNRADVEEQGGKLTDHVRSLAEDGAGADVGEETLAAGYEELVRTFDDADGGFGPAPKFPRPHTLMFLLRAHGRGGAPRALEMVERTLLHLWRGGIHDHVGGGFHRYSTDAAWLVPHFEKMLYDQALVARAALETFAVTGREEFAAIARDVFRYVLRDMTDEGGGFFSAEDADSEGEEGKFYVWTATGIREVLGDRDAAVFADVYGVREDGNWVEEASRARTGTNILHRPVRAEAAAERHGRTVEELEAALAPMREKLFAVRKGRIHPLKDHKVLTDWNGLMIASLAFAGRVLDEPDYTAAAARAADFLLTTMRPAGRLLHRYHGGSAAIGAFLDDHAFLAWGLLELHQTTQDARWLAAAKDLLHETVERFGDPDAGGFSFTADDGERLVSRTREIYDGAVPSGNSVAAYALLSVGRLTMDERLVRAGEGVLERFSGHLARMPTGFPFLLLGLDLAVGPAAEIVLAGPAGDATLGAMTAEVRSRFLPRAVVVLNPVGEEGEEIRRLVPFLAAQPAVEGAATAYVCENHACRAPVTSVEDLARLLP